MHIIIGNISIYLLNIVKYIRVNKFTKLISPLKSVIEGILPYNYKINKLFNFNSLSYIS